MKRAGRFRKATKEVASRRPDPERKARKILGMSQSDALDASILSSAPRAKLLEACRALGVSGVSRLRKEEIASHLLRALAGKSESKPEVETTRVATTEPAVLEHAARSREEFQAHKFALTEERVAAVEPAPEPAPPRFIPWSYGKDRVRAVAVDPERLYVYWEVTDEGKEGARSKLGAGAPGAWLNLRVYDTTGRLFDGTNAHSYFDHRIDDGSRQWFLDIGKPGSEAFVEIGMKSHEGYFVRIARSGKVSFPRRSPPPHRRPQWLTVRALVEPPETTGPVPESEVQRARVPRLAIVEPAPVSQEASAPIEPSPPFPERGAVELREERVTEGRWEAPVRVQTWEEGPFTVPVETPESSWETYASEATTFEVDGRTHVVFGPWKVVVRGLGAFEERRVLSRWIVYRSWTVESGSEPSHEEARILGSSALFGASERRLRGASELRLRGASELLYRGASERRLGGASERVYRAASERLYRGASERRYVAASEKLFRGASEARLGGPSTRR
jgi:hypothetical protein